MWSMNCCDFTRLFALLAAYLSIVKGHPARLNSVWIICCQFNKAISREKISKEFQNWNWIWIGRLNDVLNPEQGKIITALWWLLASLVFRKNWKKQKIVWERTTCVASRNNLFSLKRTKKKRSCLETFRFDPNSKKALWNWTLRFPHCSRWLYGTAAAFALFACQTFLQSRSNCLDYLFRRTVSTEIVNKITESNQKCHKQLASFSCSA